MIAVIGLVTTFDMPGLRGVLEDATKSSLRVRRAASCAAQLEAKRAGRSAPTGAA